MIGRLVIYSLLVVLISYEFNVYLNPREYTALVETANGKVRGIISESRGGRRFGEFYGIPFAQPPVGKLRFAAPQPAENWTDIYIADLEGIECIHLDFILDLGILGVEDCLVVNVFTPDESLVELPEPVPELESENGSEKKEKPLLPVIVYIYGGGFMSGSAKRFKAAYFMDEDVILVTFNYRLGALGFLNTGDKAVKGNMGLKDQVMALRWIRDNIKNFGGDPDQVTMIGESAGAVSVHMHMMSPLSKGLFHKAISLSGHALVPWAIVEEPARQAQRLGENLNCPTIMSTDFVECLQKLEARDIAILHRSNRFSLVEQVDGYGPTIETIVDDETFLSESPKEILQRNDYTKVPWITGVNEGEGLLWVARLVLDLEVSESVKNITEWYKAARRFLYFGDSHSLADMKKITQYYFGFKDGEEPTDFDPLRKIENITNLLSDRVFHVNLEKIIKGYQKSIGSLSKSSETKKSTPKATELSSNKNEAPLYLYYYTYIGQFKFFNVVTSVPNERLFPSELYVVYDMFKDMILSAVYGEKALSNLPACHFDEVPLLFNMGLGINIRQGSKDYPVSVELIKTISNFARKESSDLKFNGKIWPAVQSGSLESVQYMTLDVEAKTQLISSPFAERTKFWNTLNLK